MPGLTLLLLALWLGLLTTGLYMVALLVLGKRRWRDRKFVKHWMWLWAALLVVSTVIHMRGPREEPTPEPAPAPAPVLSDELASGIVIPRPVTYSM